MKAALVDIRLVLTLILVSCVLLTLDVQGWLYFPKLVVQTVTVPIQYGVYKSAQTVGKQFDFIFTARFASQENQALRVQLGEILTENAKLARELREVQAQLDQEESLGTITYNLIPARVVGVGRFLIIDQGSSVGIAEGQVVVYKDHLLGMVKTVSPKSSSVMLTSDPDSKIAVFAQNEFGRSRGVLVGQFGSEIILDKILHQEPISSGDLVYSEGLEGLIPRGLIVGSVISVLERENEVFKQAKVKAVFDPGLLDVVFVSRGE